MSERNTSDNAKRLGRRAYLSGIPLDANPMRCPGSRLLWAQAWEAERAEMEARRVAQAKHGPLSGVPRG